MTWVATSYPSFALLAINESTLAVFHWSPKTKYSQTLSFVGRIDRRNRVEYLDVCNELDNVNIYGVGSANGPVSDIEMKEIFNNTKINLNFTGVQDFQPYVYARPIDQIVRSPKGRCQEIGMCGGFVLSEYAPGIEEMFLIGEEIDVFKNENELRQKLKFYLKNPKLVVEMAHRHQKNCKEKYTIQQVWGDAIKKMATMNAQKFEKECFEDDILKIAESRAWITYFKPVIRSKSPRNILKFIMKFGILKSFKFIQIYLSARFLK